MAAVSSTSRPVPIGRLGDAAHHGQRVEHGGDGADDVLEGSGMGPGGRHHDQVGTVAEGLEHRPRHLPGGLGGDGVLGQGAGERHGGQPSGGANRMSSERR